MYPGFLDPQPDLRNLLMDRIVPSVAEFVEFNMVAVESHTICHVVCKQSKRQEIWLKPDKNSPEVFFVRIGPSSTELPPRQAFAYQPQAGYIRFIQIRDYKSNGHVTYIPKELARRFCVEDDVMIGRYGPPIFQILRGLKGAYNVALMKAVPKKCCSKEFLFYRLQDPDLRRYVEMGSDRTAGQDGVNKAHLLTYPVFMPSVDEQEVIVERILSAFARIEKLFLETTRARDLIDRIDHATLAKAFRGELVLPLTGTREMVASQ